MEKKNEKWTERKKNLIVKMAFFIVYFYVGILGALYARNKMWTKLVNFYFHFFRILLVFENIQWLLMAIAWADPIQRSIFSIEALYKCFTLTNHKSNTRFNKIACSESIFLHIFFFIPKNHFCLIQFTINAELMKCLKATTCFFHCWNQWHEVFSQSYY